MNKVSRTRRIVVTLLSFAASVVIAVCALTGTISQTLLSADFAVAALEKSDYASIELGRIEESFTSYGLSSNVDEEFFVNFFDTVVGEQDVLTNMSASVRALYSGDTVDSTYFREKLYNALVIYAQEKEMDIEDEEILAGIASFTDQLIELYSDFVTFPYATSISGYFVKIKSLVPMVMGGLALLALAALAVVFFSYKKKTVPVVYSGCAFGGASLMLLVAPLALYCSKIIFDFSLVDEALYSFFTVFMTEALVQVIIAGAVLAVITVLFVVISTLLKNRDKKKKEK